MGRIRFWQNTVCKGAGLIRKGLKEQGYNVYRMKQSGSRFRGRSGDIIINWGSQRDIPANVVGNATVLNPTNRIYSASNKLKTFEVLNTDELMAHLPEFTTDKEEAIEWAEAGQTVMCRTRLQSSKGRGIVIAEEESEVVDAPLYTQYIEPSREVRLHVFNGEVITFAQKKRMNSTRLEEEGIEVNNRVRNYENGFIFAREGVEVPDEAKEVAIKAIETLGLHHGSVDMILEEGDENPIILEVNTASGMQGSTVDTYVEAIKQMID